MVKVKNLNNTSGKQPLGYDTWLDFWEGKTGKTANHCGATDCDVKGRYRLGSRRVPLIHPTTSVVAATEVVQIIRVVHIRCVTRRPWTSLLKIRKEVYHGKNFKKRKRCWYRAIHSYRRGRKTQKTAVVETIKVGPVKHRK